MGGSGYVREVEGGWEVVLYPGVRIGIECREAPVEEEGDGVGE